MYRATVRPDGTLHLGNEAYALDFKPGATVDVSINCTGNLLVALADGADVIDLAPVKQLPTRRVVPRLPEKSVVR